MNLSLPRGLGGWNALLVSVAGFVLVSLLIPQSFRLWGPHLHFFDLRVYHLGEVRLLHSDTSLYGAPMIDSAGFTYPPFAALVMAPLAWLGLTADKLVASVLSLALLVFMLRRALMLVSEASGPRVWSLSAGLAAAVLWMEPVSTTLSLGQINLLIGALVLYDLSLANSARSKGVAIGLAAAIKLTPLLFIPYLLFSGRRRAALLAGLTFLASIALSFLLLPGTAGAYWFHAVFQSSRVGQPFNVMNQSLHAAIGRFAGTNHPAAVWELVVVAIVLGGLALAIRASRHGDEAAGYSLTAVCTLLASPVSWSHHWTLALPGIVLLAYRAHAQRSSTLAVGAGLLAIAAYAHLPELASASFSSSYGAVSLLSTNPYPLIGVIVLGLYGVSVIWPHQHRAASFRRRLVMSMAGGAVVATVAVLLVELFQLLSLGLIWWLVALALGLRLFAGPLRRIIRGRPDGGDLTSIAAWTGALVTLFSLTDGTTSPTLPVGALRMVLVGLLAVVAFAPLTDWPVLRRTISPALTLVALAFLSLYVLFSGGIIQPVWPLTLTAGILAAGLAGEALIRRLGLPSIDALSRRVDQLSRSRRGVLDVQASELRQIERDLHDGAQVRLVALSMKLGRAEDRYRDDPETAALLREAREDATAAIRELRELARGIAPPVLANRGLEAAVRSIAQRSGSEVSVRVGLGERPAPVLERAAYFVVAESLTNAVKHAPGARVEIVLEDVGDQLVVEVTDFGVGGADLSGSGLSGLRQRVEALDGVLSITSPDGVGTQVEARLPCGR